MARRERLKINVTVLDVLMKSAGLALHEHVRALGCAVRAQHRALKDIANVAQMNERWVFIGQSDDCGLVYLTAMLERVAAEYAEKRRVGFQHLGLELGQLVDHPIEKARVPFGRIGFLRQEEVV